MINVDIVGIGAWSRLFPSWNGFQSGLNDGEWSEGHKLVPELLPATLRRRAPKTVKLAVEVMHQAICMAGLDAEQVGVVFASSMGDMETTDRICHTLAEYPQLISPTQFHNSVHNAGTGYWSIVTHSHASANAICAHDFSPGMALLEAATQTIDENQPMLVVSQEVEAPRPFSSICDSRDDCAAALLMVPGGLSKNAVASVQVEIVNEQVAWPELPDALKHQLSPSSGSNMLAILAALATSDDAGDTKTLRFPLTPQSSLRIAVTSHD